MFGGIHKNRVGFKYALVLYALLGMNGAMVFSYFAYYLMHSIGVRDTLLYMNLGAAAGILLLPLYKRLLNRVKTYNGAIILANIIFLVADAFILVGYYFPEYGKAAAFLNVFTATAFGILYGAFFDGYIMHLYNFENRARITSLSQVVMNTSGALLLLLSFFFYKNPFLTILVAEAIRITLMVIVYFAPRLEYVKQPGVRSLSLGGKKVALVILAILLVQVAARFFGPVRPKIIELTIGAEYISILSAAARIITILLFAYGMKFTTSGSMVQRVSGLMVFMVFVFAFSPEIKYLLAASATIAPPFMGLFTMSMRHYMMKNLPQEETTSVIYTVNYTNYIAGILAMVITYFVVVGPVDYFLIATAIIAVSSVVLFASRSLKGKS